MRSILIQTMTCGLILTSQTFAAPFEIKHVAADATWLAHVDFDAIRASTVVQKAWQKVLDKHPNVKHHLGFARILLGTDPAADVHGVTIYGRLSNKAAAVTILAASMDPQRITLLTSIISGRESTKHGDDVIHSWTSNCCNQSLTIAAAFRGNEQLILACSVDDVKAALDVLNDKAPALAADASLAGNIPAGTTFLARIEGILDATNPCKICMAQQIDAFRLVMGENDGKSFFRVRVTTTNPKAVTIAMTTIHSVQALTNLVCKDELGRKFVNAVESNCDNRTLTIRWSASADDVWTGLVRLEEAVAKQIARLQGRKERRADPKIENESPATKTVPSEDDF